ncbi:MAG TPA: C4-type zinc ribbon domain-containing protein [Thermoanaerobaculia bacterium]|nr:C4-type zinc ribbon domain-containing protein [Thermoanaerobaculia bacterium]
MVNQVVEKLWELQTVLTDLGETEEKLNARPESFAELDEEFQSASSEMERLTERLEHIAKERRRIETQLQDQQEILRKYQGQLMQVKNQQQYTAAWKEIDTTRRDVKELEETLLKHMTEAEEIQGEIDGRSEAFEELKGRHQAAYEQWQQSLGDLRSEIESIRAKAAGIEGQVPEKLRNEFHRIFKSRQGIAVARVERESCSACRVRIRPQASQQLKRGELIFCEGCRRIFYLDASGV